MPISLDSNSCRNPVVATSREWLLTNGIGGYAMGTVACCNTRRYHGLLVAADPVPAGRSVLFSNLEIELSYGGQIFGLSSNYYTELIHPRGFEFIDSFSVDEFAYWRYKVSDAVVEKFLKVHPGENTSTVCIRNAGKASFTISLRPLTTCRGFHGHLPDGEIYPGTCEYFDHRTLIGFGKSILTVAHEGMSCDQQPNWYYNFDYPRERERGMEFREDLFTPGTYTAELAPGESISLVVTDNENATKWDDWELPKRTLIPLGAQLEKAAKMFIARTPARNSILAGYPWFSDWGRDTMIALPGICLSTSQFELARKIITDYLKHLKNGLIPNRFTESGEAVEYNAADATLWLAYAAQQTLEAEFHAEFAEFVLGKLDEVIEFHRKGTDFGIVVDPETVLLEQGEPGLQLTWMDAKVGDTVFTPRAGKAVEICGLWIQLLAARDAIAAKLAKPQKFESERRKALESFEEIFWNSELGYYRDTESDDALRPNQAIALSLPAVEVPGEHARFALEAVREQLVTPVGLRTLDPRDPSYKPRYEGALPEMDAAYHQGTVWPWLMGPYLTAALRYGMPKSEAKAILKQGKEMLREYGLNGICEVYDAEEPRRPNGCPFQAWSVGEWLRVWKLIGEA